MYLNTFLKCESAIVLSIPTMVKPRLHVCPCSGQRGRLTILDSHLVNTGTK